MNNINKTYLKIYYYLASEQIAATNTSDIQIWETVFSSLHGINNTVIVNAMLEKVFNTIIFIFLQYKKGFSFDHQCHSLEWNEK
jgi:hypothetical protein